MTTARVLAGCIREDLAAHRWPMLEMATTDPYHYTGATEARTTIVTFKRTTDTARSDYGDSYDVQGAGNYVDVYTVGEGGAEAVQLVAWVTAPGGIHLDRLDWRTSQWVGYYPATIAGADDALDKAVALFAGVRPYRACVQHWYGWWDGRDDVGNRVGNPEEPWMHNAVTFEFATWETLTGWLDECVAPFGRWTRPGYVLVHGDETATEYEQVTFDVPEGERGRLEALAALWGQDRRADGTEF